MSHQKSSTEKTEKALQVTAIKALQVTTEKAQYRFFKRGDHKFDKQTNLGTKWVGLYNSYS